MWTSVIDIPFPSYAPFLVGTDLACRGCSEERGRAYTSEEAQLAAEESQGGKRLAAVRLECESLKDVRRDLESKIAKMQVDLICYTLHQVVTLGFSSNGSDSSILAVFREN